MPHKIIAFSGKMSAGKTTAANHLVRTHNAVKLGFADAGKEEVSDFLTLLKVPFRRENLYGSPEDKAEQFFIPVQTWCRQAPVALFTPSKQFLDTSRPGYVGLTYRHLLQLWGTDYRRAEDHDYWVTQMLKKLAHQDGLVVIDDVRFLNEVRLIKEFGGVLIRIERPDLEPTSTHPSETLLDDYDGWDQVVVNGMNVEFFEEVRRCLKPHSL